MKATDLNELDLAYAPPYSSAKDPVNMAGFMIENIASGQFGFMIENIASGQLKQFHLEDINDLPLDGSVTLLDTRTEGEFSRGHVTGFINIPVDQLRENLNKLPKDKPVYVMCQSGLRSYIACCILKGEGYDAYNFSGGYRFYDAVVNDRKLIQSSSLCGMDK